ncbi:hypothetical protein Tco_1533824 [Tanacetum coccineum]
MEHICPWPHHDDHSNEDNILYVRLTSHVIDHDELMVSKDVVIKGNWDDFCRQCGFTVDKITRLKFMHADINFVDGKPIDVDVFHVC